MNTPDLWLVQCESAGETDDTAEAARATLIAVFGPDWADAPLEPDAIGLGGLWLTPVPDAVAAAVLNGDEWADSVPVTSPEGHEIVHSVLVPVA